MNENEIVENPEIIEDSEIISSSESSILSDEQFLELLEHIDGLSSSSEDVEEETEDSLEDEEANEVQEEDISSEDIITSSYEVPDGYYEAIADTQSQSVFYLSLILGVLLFLLFALGINSHKE